MTLPQLTFIFITVLALSMGQILFKLASASFELSIAGLLQGMLDAKFILALVVYFFATFMWLFVLKITPLRMAYPFAALAFVVVPLLARFLLKEDVGWNTFAGAAIIGLGVWLSVYR